MAYTQCLIWDGEARCGGGVASPTQRKMSLVSSLRGEMGTPTSVHRLKVYLTLISGQSLLKAVFRGNMFEVYVQLGSRTENP